MRLPFNFFVVVEEIKIIFLIRSAWEDFLGLFVAIVVQTGEGMFPNLTERCWNHSLANFLKTDGGMTPSKWPDIVV